jgi:hypothetical protein
LTTKSLTLGINATNAAGYTFTKLQPYTGRAGDWQGPTACLAFNGGSPECGNMLLDVGIDEMYVGAPTPSPITSIAVMAPNASSTPLAYSFPYPLSSPTPPAPTSVMLESVPATPFVNTGRYALAAANYLYDSACGRVGFQPL